MDLKTLAAQLANRINQQHVIEIYLRKVFLVGFKEGGKKPFWISVKNKLPGNQDIVLVRDEFGGVCTAYYHGVGSGFITYGEDAYEKFGEITHWMGIPNNN